MVQIGVGGFGTRWVDAQIASARVETVALVDIDPKALASAAEQLDVPPDRQFSTVGDLAGVDFDAAIVCTPPSTRPAIYRTLAQAGKHILTEKPLAESMDQARTALALKRDSGIHFVVAQNSRYRPSVRAAKRLITSGKYGRPCACQVDFFRFPRLRGFREQMSHPLIIDMSIHHFDLGRFLLTAEPVRVVGTSWNAPWSVTSGDASCTVVFEMTHSVYLTYNGSWSTLRPKEHQTTWTGDWTIECERGCVMILDDQVRAWRWKLNEEGLPSWTEGEVAELEESDSEQLQVLNQFLDELSGGPAAPTGIEDNIHSLAMVHAAIEACQTHTSVELQGLLDQSGSAG